MAEHDPNDADWLPALREAVERERKSEATGELPTLSFADRERVTRAASAAIGKSGAASRGAGWLRWGTPVAALAAAAGLLLMLRGHAPTDASADIFGAYETELVGVETARAAGAPTRGALTIASGFPFSVVLRPQRESTSPVRYAYAYLRGPSGIRHAAMLTVDVAPSGAARVGGSGDSVGDGAELLVVLTKRRTAPEALRSRLARAAIASSPQTLAPDGDEPSAQVFTVRLLRSAPHGE